MYKFGNKFQEYFRKNKRRFLKNDWIRDTLELVDPFYNFHKKIFEKKFNVEIYKFEHQLIRMLYLYLIADNLEEIKNVDNVDLVKKLFFKEGLYLVGVYDKLSIPTRRFVSSNSHILLKTKSNIDLNILSKDKFDLRRYLLNDIIFYFFNLYLDTDLDLYLFNENLFFEKKHQYGIGAMLLKSKYRSNILIHRKKVFDSGNVQNFILIGYAGERFINEDLKFDIFKYVESYSRIDLIKWQYNLFQEIDPVKSYIIKALHRGYFTPRIGKVKRKK
ncbi:MAG: hypothetical protein KatS3mg068_1551 [Candidatus Sericytochromatia bacterium]|nr:MAG: hypothetical protein KatS3mg068_1551 [Candidatus Sericytochromatia bacterium]